jgi:hypothetical protein
MKMNGGMEVHHHAFSTSTLVGNEWSASNSGRHYTDGSAPAARKVLN